ncbi:neutral zinc metallopeptidase [Nakamurella sp.]|uniref:neutral zinc metallopeptidase n=1 Tax=Nakamurella sp. TaxID=1869182 RepID=UPI00378512F2
MTRGLVVTMLAVIPVIGLSACATPTAGTATPAAAALTGAATRATTSSSPPPPAAYVPAVVAPSATASPTTTAASTSAVVLAPPATPEPPPAPEPATESAPPPAPEPLPEPAPWTDASDDDIHAEAAAAVAVTQRFWAESFAGRVNGDGTPEEWSAPELWNGDGFYDSDAGSVADCGDGKNYTGNAFFCGNATKGSGFLAWDLQFFHQHLDLGRTMVYMVIAHETGHAVQARLVHDGVDGALFDGSKRYELQADCFGGASLGRAVRDGYLTLPADAQDEMVQVASAFGGDPAGHGSPDQRNDSFQRGFASGDMGTCLVDPSS